MPGIMPGLMWLRHRPQDDASLVIKASPKDTVEVRLDKILSAAMTCFVRYLVLCWAMADESQKALSRGGRLARAVVPRSAQQASCQPMTCIGQIWHSAAPVSIIL